MDAQAQKTGKAGRAPMSKSYLLMRAESYLRLIEQSILKN
jgi:hypothetical protein